MEDFLYKYLRYYQSLPYSIKWFVGFLYRLLPKKIRFGKFYNEYLDRIKFFECAGESEIRKMQENLLFQNVNYALKNIEFYKNLGISNCNKIEDFNKIPIIYKNDIIESHNLFVNKLMLDNKILANTGGSSGTPMSFYIHKGYTRPKEKAHFDWYWKKFGFIPESRGLMVRGASLKNNLNFEYQSISNKLNISCYSINQKNISQVVNEINKFKPVYIHAYPSALKNLVQEITDSKLELSIKIDLIFLGSEYLFDDDRFLFERFFNAKVINWYGHSECLIHGGNCSIKNEYHFYPFYGYIELLDENDKPITEKGKQGRIIATGFDNKVMPLIRYDTGDIGTLGNYGSCECGFYGITLSNIDGRGRDYIILSDKTKVSTTAFIFGQHFNEFSKIKELQLQQDEIGKIILRLRIGDDYNTKDEISILKKMLTSVNNKLKIEFDYVDHIPKTLRGKHRFLIQNIIG